MSLFVFDTDAIAKQLLPPVLRGATMIRWMKVLLTPVQWVAKFFLEDFSTGLTYPYWTLLDTPGNAPHQYARWDIVTWRTKENYMCIVPHQANDDKWPSGKKDSGIYWIKVQDNFIGVDERMTYNAQIIKLEQQLNRWFRVGSAPYAYVANTVEGNQFLMGISNSDYLVNNPANALAFLYNVYTPLSIDFTVYVPETCFIPLNLASPADREKVVRQFVDLYKVPGTSYKVAFIPPPLPPTTPPTAAPGGGSNTN